MKTEFEVKVLEIDEDSIKSKLDVLGAKFLGKKHFKRLIYDVIPPKRDSWIRLRTDGNKTTLTIKDLKDNTITGMKELEIEVSDFETTSQMLEKLGFNKRANEENFRQSYLLDGVEIEIDTWPLIPTYLEIEGKSVKDVHVMVEKLGFSLDEVTSIPVRDVFMKYGFDLDVIHELKFD